ncbi:Ig-like domain-containing protein [Candidatus Uhrbacteria bacterium]|nr:Ig-like domain-containing protein [Candidatus Uhrbacteria bacterium]
MQCIRMKFKNRAAAALGVLSFCVLGLIVLGHPAFAQDFLSQSAQTSGLPQTDLIVVIARLIRAFLGILGIIFVVLVIYAGYLYMTSQGDPTKTAKAKKIISQAVIGLIIILASFAIVSFVLDALLKKPNGQIKSSPPVEKYYEPLSGALGAGIVESHYPPRNAYDIPRNTKVFITFKEPIDPASLIDGYKKALSEKDPNQAKVLNTTNVWLYETAKGKDKKLASVAVNVATNEKHTIFVFDPVDLLGDSAQNTNYTFSLQSGIKKDDGKNAFTGVYASGYEWTFQVSTKLDLTPPKVISVIPKQDANEPRNTTIEIQFNEAMDPIASAGSYLIGIGKDPLFTNIAVLGAGPKNVEGTYEISSGYQTVGFTTTDACAKDPCGDTIYCLPGNQKFSVTARAATLDPSSPPQAKLEGVSYDGLTDAAGNSLDGSGDGIACGSDQDKIACAGGAANDNYAWGFTTTAEVNSTVPQVTTLTPSVDGENIDPNKPIEIGVSTAVKSSSVNSNTASLWPDPLYKDKQGKMFAMWFDPDADNSTGKGLISIGHPAFISNAEGGYEYYPVLTQGIKSAYQICLYPATQQGGACNGADSTQPYCCNGKPSAGPCKTKKAKGILPGNE